MTISVKYTAMYRQERATRGEAHPVPHAWHRCLSKGQLSSPQEPLLSVGTQQNQGDQAK